jgi:PEGA domain
LPSSALVSASQVALTIKRSKRPILAGCDGDSACIVELGRLLGATVVVTGQSGGLGDARVIYLSAVDVVTGKEIGSTTWTTGSADSATAAVVRLLSPGSYTGTLKLITEVKNATIYVNGRPLGTSSVASFSLPVGTHALRVTHPEFRDFVRFVDVGFDRATEVAVTLQPLPVVQRDLARRRGLGAAESPRSWHRQWWVVVAGAAVIAIVAGTAAYYRADNFDPEVTLP